MRSSWTLALVLGLGASAEPSDEDVVFGTLPKLGDALGLPAISRKPSLGVAVATLVATPDYVSGALALGASVRASDPTLTLAAVTIVGEENGVSPDQVSWMRAGGWVVYEVTARNPSNSPCMVSFSVLFAGDCTLHTPSSLPQVPASEGVRCSVAGKGAMARFTHGCAKLHLWAELSDYDKILYIDADSFARPVAFNPREILERHRAADFAAKPTPPNTQFCGGRAAKVQLGLEPSGREGPQEMTVAFKEKALGVALVLSPDGQRLLVSGVRPPASKLGVEPGDLLLRIGTDNVPLGVTAATLALALVAAPRPIELTFLRPSKFSSSSSKGVEAEALQRILGGDGDKPAESDLSGVIGTMHSCSDLFNTNIMVLRPRKRTFALLVHALEHLKGHPDRESTAFDSGFLSRFFGHYYEAGGDEFERWLPFKNHMEITLSPEHWPYHPALPAAQIPNVARSSQMANFVAWGDVATVDFSGPPSLKPWAVLDATESYIARGHDLITAAWLVVDAAVGGGDGKTHRPVVELCVSLWIQWLGHLLSACTSAAVSHPRPFGSQGGRGLCEFHPDTTAAYHV